MFHTAGRVSNHLHCTKKVWYFPGKIGKFRCLQFPAFHPAAKLSTAIAGYFPAAQLNNDELGITEEFSHLQNLCIDIKTIMCIKRRLG
jgi:hypothetical protein